MARRMAGFSRAEVEHAVWDLQSPLLDNADLGTALMHIAGEISSGDSQKVIVNITGRVQPLPSTVEHHLLRIGQEAITNAVKHAQPKTIQVTLDYSDKELRLSVKDDGNGFVPDAPLKGGNTGHFGLKGIRSRARKINGNLSITSQPGQGATVAVSVGLNGNNGPVVQDENTRL
jgi:signal transduction histidine kinase